MKEIVVTKGFVALVDDEDFDMLCVFKWFLTSNGYAARSGVINGKRSTIRMHREIVGASRGMIVDHKNRNRLDNTRSNLRVCTDSQNIANCKRYATNVSGFKGVHPYKGKWGSQICFNRKEIWIGVFDSPEDAHEAYKVKAKELQGEYARFE